MTWKGEKQDLIYKAIEMGKTSEIDEILNEATAKYNEKKGFLTEDRVIEALQGIIIVKSAIKGNKSDDRSLNDILVTFKDEVILDPFAGSFQTGIANVKYRLGRKVVGIEKDETIASSTINYFKSQKMLISLLRYNESKNELEKYDNNI